MYLLPRRAVPQRSVNLKRGVGRRRLHRIRRRFVNKALRHDTLEKVRCPSFLVFPSYIYTLALTILPLALLTPRLAQDAPAVGAPRTQRVPPRNGILPARANTAKTYGKSMLAFMNTPAESTPRRSTLRCSPCGACSARFQFCRAIIEIKTWIKIEFNSSPHLGRQAAFRRPSSTSI